LQSVAPPQQVPLDPSVKLKHRAPACKQVAEAAVVVVVVVVEVVVVVVVVPPAQL